MRPDLLHGGLGFDVGPLHVEGWWVGVTLNATISVAFLAVAALLAANAIKTKQVRHNPLGLAVVVLYITCGGGHVVHTLQLLDASLGFQTVAAAASRFEYTNEWHMWAADGATAMAGVGYWMTRRRFPALVTGAAVFEDLRSRQVEALEIHDNVVQGLARAKMALDMGLDDESEEALDETLDRAQRIITELLGENEIKPGSLRKEGAPHGV